MDGGDEAGAKISRRGVLAGIGTAVIAPRQAWAADQAAEEELTLAFDDAVKRDAVAISYKGQRSKRWDLRQFGPDANFDIRSTSESVLVDPQNKIYAWKVRQWLLVVDGASLPGGPKHRLKLIFERALPQQPLPSRPWVVRAEATGWPYRARRSVFGVSQAGGPVLAGSFLEGGARLETSLNRQAGSAALADLFADRLESSGPLRLGFAADFTWWARGAFAVVNRWASFTSLRIRRTSGRDFTEVREGSDAKQQRPLLDDVVPAWATGDGLYAEPDDPVVLASPGQVGGPVLRLGEAGGVAADLVPVEGAGVRAALRQWGEPALTVSGLRIGGDAPGAAPIGSLDLSHALSEREGGVSRLAIAQLDVQRRKRADGVTETRASLLPWGKEHVVQTPFGPLEVCAPPATPPRTGAAEGTRPIQVRAVDGANGGPRVLAGFEALVALRSVGIALPARRDAHGAAEHVARLDFAGALCRFVLPVLGGPGAVAADGLVPLGPAARGMEDRAFVDLGLAKLTVLRPGDLLSLGFRFSGLLLELPRRTSGSPARVLPSRNGPVCRASSKALDGITTPDTRPLLVVDFPPQHVAERAYLRPQPAIELPRLEKGDDQALARLRQPSRPGTQDRDERIAARKTLSVNATYVPKPYADADFATKFRDAAAKRSFPEEQRYYISPEFLDPQARRLAVELAATLVPPTRRAPDVDLPTPLLLEALGPAIKPDRYDSVKDTAAAQAVEAAKEALSDDYRQFRARYAAKAATLGGSLTPYRGRAWFDAVQAKLPSDLRDWVLGYDTVQEPFDNVAAARLSGPSRLAFRVNGDDFQAERRGGGFDFSLEALTDWGSMDLAVVRRAERLMEAPSGPAPPRWARRAVLDPGPILAFQGIHSGDWIAEEEDRRTAGLPLLRAGAPWKLPPSRVRSRQRMSEVVASATAPDLFQTAIELPFRLLLSPAQDATWLTPIDSVWRQVFGQQGRPRERFTELWSARLAGAGVEAGLRAVWSPDFRRDALLDTDPPGAPPNGDWAPWSLPRSTGMRTAAPSDVPSFRTSLGAHDRHELVALTSLHGLPVLGRRDLDGQLMPGGSQFDPPPGYRLADAATDPPANGQSGTARDLSAIYDPPALVVGELSLTALGGNLDLETGFTPPASAPVMRRQADGTEVRRNLFDAFSIARWRHRTVLGRDIVVEVVYKGFLCPTGHKATLVKLTERRFEQVDGGPVAVLTQRKFLRVGEPDKTFPAYGHPNAARRWPCNRVRLTTKTTPDLIDETDLNLVGPDRLLGGGTGLVFWPQTSHDPASRVRFEMLIDSESAPAALPMLFLDNTAAHDPETTRRLVEYYNQSVPDTDRSLPRQGQPVRMAPETKSGDTTLVTDRWLLRAEGREVTRSDPGTVSASFSVTNANFEMDAFMEGQDQPGFYPFVDQARCRLTQVERFTGVPNRWVDVAYDGSYTVHGFTDEANEIFLRLIMGGPGDALGMQMAGGDRSGALAQPNLDIVGLSRRIGPVGASKPSASPQAPAAPASGPSTLPSLNLGSANLNAGTIFPENARLLGLIKLSDVLKMAASEVPVLQEVLEYGAAVTDEVSAARELVSQTVLLPAETLIDQLEGVPAPVGGGKAVDALPDVAKTLTGLNKLIGEALEPTLGDAGFMASLAGIYEAGRTVVAAIDAVLRDPLAAVSAGQAERLRDLVQQGRSALNALQVLAEAVRQPVEILGALTSTLLGLPAFRRRLVSVAVPANLPENQRAAFETAVDKAVVDALTAATPAHGGLPDWTAFATRELPKALRAQGGGLLQPYLDDAAARIEADAAQQLDLLLSPGLQQVLAAIDTQGRTLADAAKKGLTEQFDAFANAVAEIAAAVSDAALLRVLQPASAACQAVAARAGAFLSGLLGVLLPPGAATDPRACEAVADRLASYGGALPPAAETPPAPPSFSAKSPIALSEVCQALLAGVLAVADAERALRAQGYPPSQLAGARGTLATSGRRLALAIGRIERELGWLPDWSNWADCFDLPARAVSAVQALIGARNAALAALRDVVGAAGPVADALVAAAAWLATQTPPDNTVHDSLQQAGAALAGVALATSRFQRAATLIATALQPNEGESAGAADRAAALQGASAALGDIAQQLPQGSAARQAVQAAQAALGNASGAIGTLEKESRDVAAGLRKAEAMTAATLDAALAEVRARTADAASLAAHVHQQLEQAVSNKAADLAYHFLLLSAGIVDQVTPALTLITQALATAYDGVLSGRNALQTVLNSPQSDEIAQTLLQAVKSRLPTGLLLVDCPSGWTCPAPLTPSGDRLAKEDRRANLAATAFAGGDVVGGIDALIALRDSWTNGSAVQTVLRRLQSLESDLARTVLLTAVDVRAIQRELLSALQGLVPTRAVLTYDLANELSDVPSGPNPIFEPVPGTKLVISARTSVDLRNPGQPQSSVTGNLGPFGINLLGAFDVVKLNFAGLSFESGTGRSSTFDIRFKNVEMGKQAQFLQSIQSYLSPKGSGLHLAITGEGIEAGYGVNLGVIGVGALSFSNVILSAGVVLPFTLKQAQFKVAIGRSDAPFLISSGIFGGGGYLSLTSDSQRIVGFEASFDYGGVAAFGFGPLTGMGRLTLGFYARKDGDLTTVGGTFFAGGEAHIACFGIAASLLVRMTYTNGTMSGVATFSYSFSFGLGDIEFHVTVGKDCGGSLGHDGSRDSQPTTAKTAALWDRGGRVMLARNAGPVIDVDVGPEFAEAAPAKTAAPQLVVQAVTPDSDWHAYNSYFDLALRPGPWRQR